MIERFLRYSLEHGRRIALMIEEEKGLRRIHVTVTAIHADTISYISSRSKKEKILSRELILAADYARGDDGDTMREENA